MRAVYNVILMNNNTRGQPMPQRAAMNPNNRMPARAERQAAGGPLMFRSGGILKSPGEKTGRLLPADTAGRNRVARGANRQVGGLGHRARLNQYPNVKCRSDAVGARPAVRKGTDGDRTPGP
jgi:hypothetical protein